jgi:hypothetical protein
VRSILLAQIAGIDVAQLTPRGQATLARLAQMTDVDEVFSGGLCELLDAIRDQAADIERERWQRATGLAPPRIET